MTKKEYMAYHEAACKKMVEITKKKNADYTGTGDDPFANFSRVSAMGLATTEQGFLVRMLDKLSRLGSFVQRGSFLVSEESFEDTCLDLANYSILLSGYVQSRKNIDQTIKSKIAKPIMDCTYISGHKAVPDLTKSQHNYICEYCGVQL
jgi:hypothetical protein